MATSTSWTLWKRLPPRYQLSVRTFVEDDDVIAHSPPGSPKPPRKGSPRHGRGEARSPRPRISSPIATKKRSIQNIPDVEEKELLAERPSSPSGAFFPYRKSGYIDHFKTQQRVNSARAMMVSDDGCRSRSPSPYGRRAKSPTYTESRSTTDGSCKSAISKRGEIQHSKTRCDHHRKTDQNGQTVQEHPVPFQQHQYSNRIEQRKYLVRETDEGTMYIDRGKIIYFRSYKSSPTYQMSSMSRYGDGGYLASIRREYLTKPKLLAMGPGGKVEQNEATIHHDRENYNKKVANILDYYSYPDEDNISVDDLTKYTSATRRTESPRKHVNLTSRNVKRIYFAYPKQEHEVRPIPNHDLQPEPGEYFKVNQQSKLHDRNFYLKTPAHKSSFREADVLDCACGMCRIEMQLAMMAQADAERLNFVKYDGTNTKPAQQSINKNPKQKKNGQNNELQLDLSKIEIRDNSIKNNLDPVDEKSKSTNNAKLVGETVDKGTETNKLDQVLTVTIPKMETNREISEVAKENEAQTEQTATTE